MAKTHSDSIEQCVNKNRIRVRWISTKENLADILTKQLPAEPFIYLREKLLD